MPETRLMLGAPVACTDGKCGVLHSLVIDPAHSRVAHLVVEPEHRIGLGRLVSIGLVASADGEINLSCDLAAFNSLPLAESTEVVQDLSAGYIFLHSTVLLKPEVHEVLPTGEAGLQTATEVVATDGPIGVVSGLLTAGEDYQISSVFVSEERLLWGHKTVAIPVSTVAVFDGEALRLNLATADVERVAVGSQG
jgi:sporulation protein YlmC with PRC-barrel domain